MFDFIDLQTKTKVSFHVNHAGPFEFQLEYAIKGPFDFDNKKALKEGYSYLTDIQRLSIPEYCEVALVYRLIDVGPELDGYIRRNKFGWDDMNASASQSLYKEMVSRLDDASYFSRIHKALQAVGLGNNCKSFKQIAIIVSCKETFNTHGLRPKSGWFW